MAKASRKGSKRRRFKSASQVQSNLHSITRQQQRYRRAKRRFKKEQAETFKPEIIENIEKSKRAWENELRKIKRPEDLDGFEDD